MTYDSKYNVQYDPETREIWEICGRCRVPTKTFEYDWKNDEAICGSCVDGILKRARSRLMEMIKG